VKRRPVSRPATEEEQLFYAQEKAQIAQRMGECEQESAELDVSLEEIHRSIAFYQESMQNVLDEQDKLEIALHECQQRELTFLEERTLLEEEYLTRLSSGLPNWPAEIRSAARHFVQTVQRSHTDESGGDFAQLRVFAQWLREVGARGPKRGVVSSEHCLTEERIDAVRSGFLHG